MNLMNPEMVCYYRYSCLDLPVALVDSQVEGCPSRLHHISQGEYVAMNEIDRDGGEWNISRDYVDKIWGHGKSETLKKVGESTVYGTEASGEDEKEMKWKILGGGGDEVSFMPVFYPRGKVSVSSLGSFSYVGSSFKPSNPSVPLSIGVHRIQECYKKKRGRKLK